MNRRFSVTVGMMAAAVVLSGAAKPRKALAGDPAALFPKHCVMCHGADGKGSARMAKMFKLEPAALDLTKAATAAKKDDELIATVTTGHEKMPAFGKKLSAEEIKGLVGHVRTIGTAKAPAPGAGVAAPDGAALFTKHCGSCHGADAKGNEKMAKMFKAEPAALDLVDDATLAKSDADLAKVTVEGSGKMPAFGKKLKPEEIAAVIARIRALKK